MRARRVASAGLLDGLRLRMLLKERHQLGVILRLRRILRERQRGSMVRWCTRMHSEGRAPAVYRGGLV